jgi:hypothetical protein
VRSARAALRDRRSRGENGIDALEQRLSAFDGPDGFTTLNGQLASLLGIIQGADVAPTTQAAAAAREKLEALETLLGRWRTAGLAPR